MSRPAGAGAQAPRTIRSPNRTTDREVQSRKANTQLERPEHEFEDEDWDDEEEDELPGTDEEELDLDELDEEEV
ncbi:MAG: hypothetical protein KGJ43_02465 [Acidobacteriota bacterium]|nr:hypothetical protein [Acidobacteriota bacterium]